jgi:Transposase DDE domain
MNKFTHLLRFVGYLFDEEKTARKATPIIEGILKARSPRLSDIAREMAGGEEKNYKCIQRFLKSTTPQETLLRLFQESASFVIGDPTEMPRPQAKQTDYVGTLSDAQTSGYWLLILSTPYHGRALPCCFVDYSSKTINQEASSRNQYHFEAFAKVKELLGERPLVMDREFSYLELMENLVLEGIHFVIRLKVGAKFTDQEGKLVALSIAKGETRILNKVFYMGKVFMNVIGVWREGFSQPMWVMTDLPAEDGLNIYLQRMKIEESFRDMKSLLGLERLMNKRRDHMEKMVALLLIAYAIGLWLGEVLRETLFPKDSPKKKLYSGLFVLLKLKFSLPPPVYIRASTSALSSFGSLVQGVRSNV